MNVFSDIAFHTHLPGDCFVQPLRFFIKQSMNCTAAGITSLALGILLSPMLALAGLLGCAIKAGAIAYGYNPAKRSFEVKKITTQEFPEAAQCARAWCQLAKKKHAALLQKDRKSRAQFYSSQTVTQLIDDCFTFKDECNPKVYEKACACFDQSDPSKAFQAIALFKKDAVSLQLFDPGKTYLKVVHLATNPINIRSEINRYEYDRVEGASTALIRYLAKRCLEKGYEGLYLESTESAQSFYKKLGFVPLERFIVSMTESTATPMYITKSRIRHVIPQG